MTALEEIVDVGTLLDLDTVDSTLRDDRYLEGQMKGAQARNLVIEVAESFKDNPEELRNYFIEDKSDDEETAKNQPEYTPGDILISGFATSVYHQIMKDNDEDKAIEAIQKYANGGWGATITSKKKDLEFSGFQLKYAEVKEDALPEAEFVFNTGKFSIYRKGSFRHGSFLLNSGSFSHFDSESAHGARFDTLSGKEAKLGEGVFENIRLDKPEAYKLASGFLVFDYNVQTMERPSLSWK